MNVTLKKLLSEIDLTKSPNSNFPYLSRQAMSQRVLPGEDDQLPLQVTKSEWQIESDVISRVYHVDNRRHFSYFLNNILDHALEIGHDPVMIVKFPNISIKLSTHDLDQVTELDFEFAKFIDEVYEDIKFISTEF